MDFAACAAVTFLVLSDRQSLVTVCHNFHVYPGKKNRAYLPFLCYLHTGNIWGEWKAVLFDVDALRRDHMSRSTIVSGIF